MLNHQQTTGKLGEDIALNYLSQKGYRLITSNFHSRFGEIDLILKDKGTLVFVEVKARYDTSYGTPQEAVTPWKIKKIIKTAQYFSLLHPELPKALRIDVIALQLSPSGEVASLEHLENITG